MKVIIAGSRGVVDYKVVANAIERSTFKITEVVSGGAKGVDSLGESWARTHVVPCKRFIPNWGDVDSPDAVVKQGKYGLYNAKAGYDRNEEMAEYADALIAIWDGESNGTRHMINCMRKLKKQVFVEQI